LTPLSLVLVAALAGLLVPSERLAQRSDLILAALVFTVAVAIEPGRLRGVLGRWRLIAAAVFFPFATLLPLSLLLGLAFETPEREGLVALGLASSEVAAVALVVIAAGDAAFALAVVALSLVASALVAPAVAPLVADSGVDAGELVLRFSFVLVVPLVAGMLVAARRPPAALNRVAEVASVVVLSLLVYASLGELGAVSELADAALASLAFLAVSALAAAVLLPVLGDLRTGGLVFALRDFAVAAALAVQIGPAGAALTPAVYGVLMLVAAAGLTSVISRRARGQAVNRVPTAASAGLEFAAKDPSVGSEDPCPSRRTRRSCAGSCRRS
jgi:predicted Na+-dependent transporter